MSTNLNSTNDKYKDLSVDYLNNRLSYLERIIKSKYEDISHLIKEISSMENLNLKYDLIDVLIKHGANLSSYKAELVDIKDMINSINKNITINAPELTKDNNDIAKDKPHNNAENLIENNQNISSSEKEIVVSEKTEVKDKKLSKLSSISGNIKFKNFQVGNEKQAIEQKEKSEIAKEKIITNLDKLILYKENTFNDLIEMIDFHTKSGTKDLDLSKFIENLESQIVELNEYKNNIIKNHSLSKSIELGSNGKITFSRIFIEKERLLDKNRKEYIRVLAEMNNLYSKFVDIYLSNINSMKQYLDPDKINLMQSNCSKVIYDLKLIRNLCSSLDKIKSV